MYYRTPQDYRHIKAPPEQNQLPGNRTNRKRACSPHPRRRWVVERKLPSFLSKCREALVRYGEKVANYPDLI